jgi:hypothetical protein
MKIGKGKTHYVFLAAGEKKGRGKETVAGTISRRVAGWLVPRLPAPPSSPLTH